MCPEYCLCMEVLCCFSTSVAATRWLLQDERLLVNTKCDNCLIVTFITIDRLACIFYIIAAITRKHAIHHVRYLLVSQCCLMLLQSEIYMLDNSLKLWPIHVSFTVISSICSWPICSITLQNCSGAQFALACRLSIIRNLM